MPPSYALGASPRGHTAAVFRAAERFRGNAPFLRVGGQSSGAIRRRLSARPNASGEMPPSYALGASPRGPYGGGYPRGRTLPGKCLLPTRWGPVLGGYTATVSVQPNASGEMPPDFAPGALNVPQR